MQLSPNSVSLRFRFKIFDFWRFIVRIFRTFGTNQVCKQCIRVIIHDARHPNRFTFVVFIYTNDSLVRVSISHEWLLMLLGFSNAFVVAAAAAVILNRVFVLIYLMFGLINQMGQYFIDVNIWWKNLVIESLTWTHPIIYGYIV